ncbi:uncharacterized protein LOC141595760 [Silene latifolia]|uniref:uncharacterized protein LOC141595760 n=1 Tax=Silene latifolia TaxID=37657 RepID=UPI003D77AFEE
MGLRSIIRDKISKKLQCWRGMLLSKAGKEVLIKVIAQSISNYAMSVFKLPDNFRDDLRSLVSKYWWGSKNGKQVWRLMTDTESLMVHILKGKYFPNGSFMEAELGESKLYLA